MVVVIFYDAAYDAFQMNSFRRTVERTESSELHCSPHNHPIFPHHSAQNASTPSLSLEEILLKKKKLLLKLKLCIVLSVSVHLRLSLNRLKISAQSRPLYSFVHYLYITFVYISM